MTSVFPWPSHWWTNTGSEVDGGLELPSGAIFVPWATEATPIGGGEWTVDITYSAEKPSRVVINQNPFSQADENHQVGQHALGAIDLPATAAGTELVQVRLPDVSQPLWTPQFQVDASYPGIKVSRVEVYESPAAPPADPPGISIRSSAVSGGVAGGVPALSATSRAGDLAVLMYASQWGNTAAKPPAGWDGKYTANSADGRSGYVAALRVTDPSQTKGVVVTGGTEGSARERAVLVVLSGVESYSITGWSAEIPAEPSSHVALVGAAQHGSSRSYLVDWGDKDTRIRTGEASNRRSWSVLQADIVIGQLSIPDPKPQMFCAVDLVPKQDTAATPSVTVQGKGTANIYVWDGSSQIPSTMVGMPVGYSSIDEMMSHKGFVVAHRGGSGSWPEMSMRAYTNSVAHGVGALEVSTHRTKDGVWILAHDQNLQRVDPSAPSTPIAQMTWEEVSKYRTKGEPILRVEEYLEAYGSSHVTVLDPKYSAAEWTDLAAKLPADAKNRVIWKSAGDAGWLGKQWRDNGWKCWGYAYEQHADSGELASWSVNWDYLGFPYEASEAHWKIALSLGKPVWAHICPSKAAYDAGMARGAVGCMVAGVADVLPGSV